MIRINFLLTLLFSSVFTFSQSKPDYLNKDLPIEQRSKDLLSRMTLEEKVGQMCQYVAFFHMKESKKKMEGKNLIESDQYGLYPGMGVDSLKKLVILGHVGSFLHVKDAEESNEIQKLAMQSRLKIPVLIGIDAIHGHALISGSTVFPTQLGLSSSWDDEMLYQIAKITAEEVRATGMHWTFSPNVDVARDARWGRFGETFGEDPLMVSRMGVAFTKGYQGDFSDKNIIACAKHFIAGSEPLNGTNSAPMDASVQQLRDIWFPPYKAQVDAGVYSFMAAHNELNGVPCHGNKWLLTDILRTEWGFKGFVVSDWMDIERLYKLHKVARSQKEAVEQTIVAGMDMHMHGTDFLEPLVQLVKEGRISEEQVNRSCKSILDAKFRLGLFENPFVDLQKSKSILFQESHKALALKSAEKSIILLKNESKLLPLNNPKSILVTGANANNLRIMGDWALPQPEENIVTVYEGIKEVFKNSKVDYINSGESLFNSKIEDTNAAVEQASKYETVVVVIGSNSLRYETKEIDCGENIDRQTINLLGNQLELVKRLKEKNKNVIVVFVNGRPVSEPWIKDNISTIIEAWEPGAMGGLALANILNGTVNPSAKLTATIPYSVGQITYTYNYKPSNFFHPYIDGTSKPLWDFGFGLSYTTYKYSNLKIENKIVLKNQPIKVSVDVANIGTMDGEEIVQLYINDEFATVTRPIKELKDYKRVAIKKGETKTVSFEIPFQLLAFYTIESKYVVEPGTFKIMVGSSSNDSDLLKDIVEFK